MTAGGLDAAFHDVLLRVAGWAPDEMVCAARDWLARGRLVEVAQAVTFVAIVDRIPMTPGDVDLLRTVLSSGGIDTDVLADLELANMPAMPLYAMAPVYPGRDRAGEVPYSLDLTERPSEERGLDEVERALLAAVGAGAAVGTGRGAVVGGLWRAWRCPAIPTPWPPPRRMYLVQANHSETEPPLTLAARLQRALAQAGEASPQVEVFVDQGTLPPYQRTALGCSALLWTNQPRSPVRIAGLFDPVDGVGGPGFAASRPTLRPPERDEVLAYLDAGSQLLTTTALMDDVVENGLHGVVPMSFRTDGHWIWTEASAYYLRQYGFAPDDALLQHIRSRRYEVKPVDAVAQHRALAALQSHTSGEDGSRCPATR
jgi:hypothetical protein